MKLIFLSGKKRSGKDTTADYIIEKYGAIKYQLAAPIKDALFHGLNCLKGTCGKDLKLSRSNLEGINYDREQDLGLTKQEVIYIISKALIYLDMTCLHIKDVYYEDGYFYNSCETKISDVINNIEDVISVRRLMQILGTDIVVNIFDDMYWVKLFTLSYLSSFKKTEYFIVPDTRQQHEMEAARAMGATVIHVVRPGKSTDKHITEKGLPIEKGDIIINNDSNIESLYKQINEAIKNL